MTEELKVSLKDLRKVGPLIVEDNAPLGLIIEDRYEVLHRLAKGGMGEIFLAHDARLDRPVAMKILASAISTAKWQERFQAEAVMMSRIEHPGIVPIHDLGLLPDGRLYYTMKYVAGRTFQELIAQRPNRDLLVRIMTNVCQIVHHAHERGVIHRDLKPANIMVDEREHAFVMDWGIARVLDEYRMEMAEGALTKVTGEGVVMGTLGYMSPEQARGRSRDVSARSDVYSLGAMLMDVVNCRGSFGSDRSRATMEQLRDLTAIGRRAMTEDPAGRYASARFLADELRRYSKGEPVLARPPGPTAQTVRWVGRHKSSVAAFVITVVAATGAFVVAQIQIAKAKAEQAQVEARRIDDLRKNCSLLLEGALNLRRAGNVAGMREFADRTQLLCNDVMRNFPRLAEPHYCLGRIHRALMNTESALAAQDAALERDPTHEGARYERAWLLVGEYQRYIDGRRAQATRDYAQSMDGIPGVEPQRMPTRDELEDARAVELRNRAVVDLKASRGEAAQAILAWLNRDVEASRRLWLHVAQNGSPSSEAEWWLASIELQEGHADAAIEWYTRAYEKDRGFIPVILERAAVRSALVTVAWMRGSATLELMKRVIEDVDAVLALDPSHVDALVMRARYRCQMARETLDHSGDDALLLQAIEDLNRANQLRPDFDLVFHHRGEAYTGLAAAKMRGQKDSSAEWEQAISDYQTATTLKPNSVEHWFGLGNAYMRRVAPIPLSSPDYPGLMGKAIDALDRALRLNRNHYSSWAARGMAKLMSANLARIAGKDCKDLYEQALADVREAMRLNPQWVALNVMCATIHLSEADEAYARHRDPARKYGEALREADKAVAGNPSWFKCRTVRATIRIKWGMYSGNQRQDPTEHFLAAIEDTTRVIETQPPCAEAWMLRGEARFRIVGWESHAGRDGWAYLEKAREDLTEAVRLGGPTFKRGVELLREVEEALGKRDS